MKDRERVAGYYRLAKERKDEEERLEAEKLARVEFAASLPGRKTIVAKTFMAVADQLSVMGYKMTDAVPYEGANKSAISVPHKDGSMAIVRKRLGK